MIVEGQYPAWRSVIPPAESQDYSITLNEPDKVLVWVKMIPSLKTTNGVEFNVMPATGQAAGALAALGDEYDGFFSNIPVEQLRHILKEHGAILP